MTSSTESTLCYAVLRIVITQVAGLERATIRNMRVVIPQPRSLLGSSAAPSAFPGPQR